MVRKQIEKSVAFKLWLLTDYGNFCNNDSKVSQVFIEWISNQVDWEYFHVLMTSLLLLNY